MAARYDVQVRIMCSEKRRHHAVESGSQVGIVDHHDGRTHAGTAEECRMRCSHLIDASHLAAE